MDMPEGNKKTTDGATLLRRSALLLSAVVGLVMAGLLAYLYLTPNVQVWQSRQDVGVTRVMDGSFRETECDGTPLGVLQEYRFTLDDTVGRDVHLAFYIVHQYADVYLDGQLVYSLKPSEENRIGKTVGSNWVMIPLYREDIGKEVLVEITPVYEGFRGRTVEFLVGSQLGIYTARLRQDLPQLLLGVTAVFAGLIFLCIAAYQLIAKKKQEVYLAALGLFAVMLGIWRLADTRFTPFALPERPVFLIYTSLAMLMLGMFPLIRSVQERRRDRRILDALCIIIALVCLVQVILQLTGVVDLRVSLPVTHILMFFSAAVLVGTVVYERRKYSSGSRKELWEKLPGLILVGAMVDVACFYITGTSSGLIFSLSALLLYIVFMGITTFGRQEKLLLEREAELERNRVAITISQIQPHFLYNALSSIADLCRDAPEARNALNDFAAYLRGNMDSLTSRGLIHFSQERKHVETYLRLEKLRFGDMLQVEYDIREEDFLLPPLTVQPLVENAVKHGVCQKRQGGTVTLRTRRDGDDVTITVEDDGVGFDPDQPLQDGRSHVGIQNVRSRLRQMANGTLDIRSVPGVGTAATIILYGSDKASEVEHAHSDSGR